MVYGMVLADEVPSTLHNANLGPFQDQNQHSESEGGVSTLGTNKEEKDNT